MFGYSGTVERLSRMTIGFGKKERAADLEKNGEIRMKTWLDKVRTGVPQIILHGPER